MTCIANAILTLRALESLTQPEPYIRRLNKLRLDSRWINLINDGTAANVHDVTQAQSLLHGEESDVFGDAGYQGIEKREESQTTPVNWHIALRPGKRRALDRSPLGEMMEKLEQAKASIRAKVEHPFHVVKNLFCHRKTRYRGLAKNTAQLFTLFGFANLMLARRWLLVENSQVAP